MKLFPYHPKPAPVRGWHVPVPKMKLADLVDPTWDLTLQKIIPFIDGVNDVRRVAWLADVSLPLTQTALQHLLYYDTILLLDMFFFGSCYAPRPGIHDFIANRDDIVEECANYVCLSSVERPGTNNSNSKGTPIPETTPETPPPRNNAGKSQSHNPTASSRPTSSRPANTGANTSGNTGTATTPTTPNKSRAGTGTGTSGGGMPGKISNYQLIRLLTTFCVGRSIMEWIKLHHDSGFDVLEHIDVRRLVQFGVIKGLLYRVHKYVVSKQYIAMLASGQARPTNALYNLSSQEGDDVYADPANNGNEDGGVDDGDDDDEDTVAVDPQGQFRHGSLSARNSGESVPTITTTSAAAASSGTAITTAAAGSIKGRRSQSQLRQQKEKRVQQHAANFRMGDPLQKYTDGCHSFDQIITEQNLTDAEIMERLKRLQAPAGDLAVFYR